MSFEKMLADRINRSVPVEQRLLDIANGKRPAPTGEDCRRMAMDLGVPTGVQAGTTVRDVLHELARATDKFPTWPTDPLHAVAVVGEEFGELTKAVLQYTYEPSKTSRDEIRSEALQTAAMVLRFIESLDQYAYTKGEQHEQCNWCSDGLRPIPKCDGNHGAPRCRDPECWYDS
jgi:NTP pyrophosphatase (non-canonical NTP hydrolase)